MTKKEDLRIRKTKASLYKALLQLMEEKSFEDIKIIDICKISMINRSTFYDHFSDKYELLSSLMEDSRNELLNNLRQTKNIKINSVKEYYLLVVKELISFIDKNTTIYSVLSILKKNNNSVAHDMMFDVAKSAVLEKLNEHCINHSNISNETIAVFYISGLTSLLFENVLDMNNLDDNTLVEILNKLIPDLDYLEIKDNKSMFN